MKEIYMLLNEVTTNLDDYIVETMTDEEKRRILNNITETTKKTKKQENKNRKYAAVAACIALVVIFAGVVNYNNVAYATAKNIAWQIGNFLGIEKNLQDYTTVLGTSKTDQGYTITLNEIILDKDQLVVSSSIKSEEKLSEGGLMPFAEVYVNGRQVSVAGGGSIRRVDDYTEKSVLDYELEGIDTNKRLDIELVYTGILKGDKETSGKWEFHFEADGTKLAENTTHIALNNRFTLPNGSSVVLTEYTSNDLGQKIYFKFENWEAEKDPMYELTLKGTDNLGNQVEFDTSYFKGVEKQGRLNTCTITGLIGEHASFVSLKPYAAKMPEKSGRMSNDYVTIGESFIIQITEK